MIRNIMTSTPQEQTPEKRYRNAITENLSSDELQILTLLRNAPPNGMSCRQLQQELNLPVTNIRIMCNKLNSLGLLHIRDTDTYPCRLYTLTALGNTLRN